MNKVSFWNRKNVFISGATGLLGPYLIDKLIEKKANIVTLIRDWVPNSNLIVSELYKKINVVRGELEDYSTIKRVLNEYEVETVFHLGAQTIVGIAEMAPISTFEANIRGSWNILDACRLSKTVDNIIFASSDKAYGKQKKLPYTEDMPLEGRYPYDVSKSCVDLLAKCYYCTYKLPICITRCGNFYGGGDLNFNRIIPGTIRAALHNQRPVIRSDGKYTRDYIYVKDVVNAYLLLAEKMNSSILGEAFNFSNETPITVLDLTKKILSTMGREDLKPIILNQAKHEIRHQYLSAEKAKKLLCWKPQYTLEEGLRETIVWYKNYFGRE